MSKDQPMPQDYLRLCLEKRVKVQTLDQRELIGVLHAYDEHSSLVLGDTAESFPCTTPDGQLTRQTRPLDLLFIRGDRVITISLVD
jgi:small nuclear ribonucleoprotein (snRNP)-like protein